MLHTVYPFVLTLSLFALTAVATHFVMSFGQTLIHYKVAHHPMGGKIFRDHINFHHTHYSEDHLVSPTYLGDEGNTTPYFVIPVLLASACAYLLLPLDLFIVAMVTVRRRFTRTSVSTTSTTWRDRGFGGLRGLGASEVHFAIEVLKVCDLSLSI